MYVACSTCNFCQSKTNTFLFPCSQDILYYISVEFLQRNLKNLKDNLNKCLDKRQQMTKSGAPASALPQCKYFEQMRFLHEKTANQPTESNIPMSMELTGRDECDPCPSATSTTPSRTPKRKASDDPLIPPVNSRHASKTTRQDAIDLAILKQLERTEQKMDEAPSNESTSDEVSLYCQSLIPIIRSLPPKKKRQAMIKLSQQLFQIEFNDD